MENGNQLILYNKRTESLQGMPQGQVIRRCEEVQTVYEETGRKGTH